jgi:hypothetical protein
MKRILVVLCLLLIIPVLVLADGADRSTTFSVEGAYYLPDNKGYGVSDGGFAPITYDPIENPGRDLGSTWGPAEIQALITHRIKVPFLVGSGALTSDNNLTLTLTGALTPITVRLETQATLTPIAFLNVFAGAMIGTGWYLGTETDPLFNGMGKILASGDAELSCFAGVVSESWIGGTFQFDLAAVVPGEWNHVVVLVRPKLQYAFFSAVGNNEPWMWEEDNGENYNGFKFFSSYFLGYQMPLPLDTVGLLIETEQNLGYVKDLSTMASGGWGSDYVQITVSPIFNFLLSDSSSLAVLLQFRRERLYSDPSIFQNHFINRNAVGTYWDFYRIAFSYTLLL